MHTLPQVPVCIASSGYDSYVHCWFCLVWNQLKVCYCFWFIFEFESDWFYAFMISLFSTFFFLFVFPCSSPPVGCICVCDSNGCKYVVYTHTIQWLLLFFSSYWFSTAGHSAWVIPERERKKKKIERITEQFGKHNKKWSNKQQCIGL